MASGKHCPIPTGRAAHGAGSAGYVEEGQGLVGTDNIAIETSGVEQCVSCVRTVGVVVLARSSSLATTYSRGKRFTGFPATRPSPVVPTPKSVQLEDVPSRLQPRIWRPHLDLETSTRSRQT